MKVHGLGELTFICNAVYIETMVESVILLPRSTGAIRWPPQRAPQA